MHMTVCTCVGQCVYMCVTSLFAALMSLSSLYFHISGRSLYSLFISQRDTSGTLLDSVITDPNWVDRAYAAHMALSTEAWC